MTDLEKIELAIRRTVDHLKIQPHETSIEAALALLADQIARDEMDRQRWTQCPGCGNLTRRPSDQKCVACDAV